MIAPIEAQRQALLPERLRFIGLKEMGTESLTAFDDLVGNGPQGLLPTIMLREA